MVRVKVELTTIATRSTAYQTWPIVMVGFFLRQWRYCCRSFGIFLFGVAKLHSILIGFSRQIVDDDIFVPYGSLLGKTRRDQQGVS